MICSHLTNLHILRPTTSTMRPTIFSGPYTHLIMTRKGIHVRALPTSQGRPIRITQANIITQFTTHKSLLSLKNRMLHSIRQSRRQYTSSRLITRKHFRRRQGPTINHHLVLSNTTRSRVLMTITPIKQRSLRRTICTFNSRRRTRITTHTSRLPHLNTPYINLFSRGVQHRTNMSRLSNEGLRPSITTPTRKRVRHQNFARLTTILIIPFILPMCMTITTTFTSLTTSIPQIPSSQRSPLSRLRTRTRRVTTLCTIFRGQDKMILPRMIFISTTTSRATPFMRNSLPHTSISHTSFRRSRPHVTNHSCNVLRWHHNSTTTLMFKHSNSISRFNHRKPHVRWCMLTRRLPTLTYNVNHTTINMINRKLFQFINRRRRTTIQDINFCSFRFRTLEV